MTSDEYESLLERMQGYGLPRAVLADVEHYRSYCEKHAWNSALALGLWAADRANFDKNYESLKKLCPYGR